METFCYLQSKWRCNLCILSIISDSTILLLACIFFSSSIPCWQMQPLVAQNNTILVILIRMHLLSPGAF
ncbi:hypothetical protein POPTR_005G212601v4 [Populus trichocarpa]|uniref:Uncharacterized protein n=1 Tax=Populus trichocarpa TaxID=3694 RepID=A0ACC0T182_POPTR|nr:hypothetical protein BDE02_05G178900 [Populus trichocarpa]KAI9395298.1 hypothetical protein POPTR_005G212601v4 [Populus trichocarpa]